MAYYAAFMVEKSLSLKIRYCAFCGGNCALRLHCIDSVPAVFAITQDSFLVSTSNIFAIPGLRALYFALAAMIHRFVYSKYALALVLVFIGFKIFLVRIIGKFPPALSLSVTCGLIAGGILVALWRARKLVPTQQS